MFDTRENAATAYQTARQKLKNAPGTDNSDTSNDQTAIEAAIQAARAAAFEGVNMSLKSDSICYAPQILLVKRNKKITVTPKLHDLSDIYFNTVFISQAPQILLVKKNNRNALCGMLTPTKNGHFVAPRTWNQYQKVEVRL